MSSAISNYMERMDANIFVIVFKFKPEDAENYLVITTGKDEDVAVWNLKHHPNYSKHSQIEIQNVEEISLEDLNTGYMPIYSARWSEE